MYVKSVTRTPFKQLSADYGYYITEYLVSDPGTLIHDELDEELLEELDLIRRWKTACLTPSDREYIIPPDVQFHCGQLWSQVAKPKVRVHWAFMISLLEVIVYNSPTYIIHCQYQI